MYRLAFFILAMLMASVAGAQTPADEDPSLLLRPDPSGTPTAVEVNAFVSDISSISNVEQSFTVDLYIVARWKDSRLARDVEQTLPLEAIWHPTLVIMNERDLENLLPEVVLVTADGDVRYMQRLIGTLSAPMDLHEFPYDNQTLSIHIVDLVNTPEDVALKPRAERTDGFDEFSATGWHLSLGATRAEPLVLPSSEERRARLVFGVTAKRDVGFYVWTMFVPLALILLMAWMVFWIDPSFLPSQIALSTASVFTLIAFRFSIRLSLPTVGYMTRMDKFLLGCTVLVFFALGQAVVTGRLVKQGHESLAHAMDRWGRWIYLSIVVALIAIYL